MRRWPSERLEANVGIGNQYLGVRGQVEAWCRACGRDIEEVRLIAVSKTVGPEGVAAALEAGARDFGENRPDQITGKSQAFPQASWHFIGNIQSRRIPDIVASAGLIHSLFQVSHARRISQEAQRQGKVQDVLVEVNVSGEESKGGVTPAELASFVGECQGLSGLRVRGLMTMAPQGDAQEARACFANLRRLAEGLRERMEPQQAALFTELSMGMSDDWREAIAEGSTMVRIGRAIFNEDFA